MTTNTNLEHEDFVRDTNGTEIDKEFVKKWTDAGLKRVSYNEKLHEESAIYTNRLFADIPAVPGTGTAGPKNTSIIEFFLTRENGKVSSSYDKTKAKDKKAVAIEVVRTTPDLEGVRDAMQDELYVSLLIMLNIGAVKEDLSESLETLVRAECASPKGRKALKDALQLAAHLRTARAHGCAFIKVQSSKVRDMDTNERKHYFAIILQLTDNKGKAHYFETTLEGCTNKILAFMAVLCKVKDYVEGRKRKGLFSQDLLESLGGIKKSLKEVLSGWKGTESAKEEKRLSKIKDIGAIDKIFYEWEDGNKAKEAEQEWNTNWKKYRTKYSSLASKYKWLPAASAVFIIHEPKREAGEGQSTEQSTDHASSAHEEST